MLPEEARMKNRDKNIQRDKKNAAVPFVYSGNIVKKLKGKRALFISVYRKYSVLEFHGVPSSPPALALLLCK